MSTWKQLSFINMPRKSDGHGIRNPVRWKVITKHYAKFSRAISLDDPAASILGISKKKYQVSNFPGIFDPPAYPLHLQLTLSHQAARYLSHNLFP